MATSPTATEAEPVGARRPRLGGGRRVQPRAAGVEPVDVEPADILVGLLLSDARPNGEARVLLSHFGLTARDVLPAAYPLVSSEELQRYADGVSASELPPLSPISSEVLAGVERLRELRRRAPAPPARGAADLDVGAHAAAGHGPRRGGRIARRAHVQLPVLAGLGERGATLGQMLEQAHPRRPVDLPAYAADVAEASVDLVGVGAEVDAFAYLLASRACSRRSPSGCSATGAAARASSCAWSAPVCSR